MRTPRVSREREEQFFAVLATEGNVITASKSAGVSRLRMEALRRSDSAFAAEWAKAEETVLEQLQREAWRRAVKGVPEPVVSDGRVVRDDTQRPISSQRYSDELLLELIKAKSVEMSNGPDARAAASEVRSLRWIAVVFVLVVATWAATSLALDWARVNASCETKAP